MRLQGTQCIQTTAYHLIANGLVERSHWQLKGAMKCLSDTTHWTKALPHILLGMRTTFKQDCRYTAEDLVYGTTLRLPGDYFTSTPTSSQLEPHSYVTTKDYLIHKLQSPNICKQKQCTIHIHSDLSSCPYVIARYDGIRKSLQPPYDGPFKVLQRSSKHFTLDVAGQKQVVSLDCLKPAYMDIPQDIVLDSTTSSNNTDTVSSTTLLHYHSNLTRGGGRVM